MKKLSDYKCMLLKRDVDASLMDPVFSLPWHLDDKKKIIELEAKIINLTQVSFLEFNTYEIL